MKSVLSEAARTPFASQVEEIVASTAIYDIHTHLFDPGLSGLLLRGLDELLTYHYLVAESFRHLTLPYEKFWALSRSEQAGLIWNALFIEHSPVSEACRGVLTTLHAFGLDPRKRDLGALRNWFAERKPEAHLDHCLELAGVRKLAMTNSPFDDAERQRWDAGFARDGRFSAALRIDELLLSWGETAPKLAQWGYAVEANPASPKSAAAVRRFLADWT